MNRVRSMRAAAGLAAYLASATTGGLVVIGYDARHKSDAFARDTAAVITGAGLRAAVLPRPLPTPVLAFAVRHLGAAAGVMVTASHNPPRDNGYKVYLGDGSQIVPPADAEISAAIDAVGPAARRCRSRRPAGACWTTVVVAAYLDARWPRSPLGDAARRARSRTRRCTAWAATCCCAAFDAGRVPGAGPWCAEQAEPDPDFPTVAFPNPEEPGAMDLALATLASAGADLVIANDPDADRCAVASAAAAAAGGC